MNYKALCFVGILCLVSMTTVFNFYIERNKGNLISYRLMQRGQSYEKKIKCNGQRMEVEKDTLSQLPTYMIR